MKKILLYSQVALCAMLLSACGSTTSFTTRSQQVDMTIESKTLADLNVSPTKIHYDFKSSSEYEYQGQDNVIKAAIQQALMENGDADVLVEMNYTIRTGHDGKIEYVHITGYPATFTNFRSAFDYQPKAQPAPAVAPAAPATPATADVNTTTVEVQSSPAADKLPTADEYYIAYLFKSSLFDMKYRTECAEEFDMRRIESLLNQHSVSELKKLGKLHASRLNKYVRLR